MSLFGDPKVHIWGLWFGSLESNFKSENLNFKRPKAYRNGSKQREMLQNDQNMLIYRFLIFEYGQIERAELDTWVPTCGARPGAGVPEGGPGK